MECRWIARQRPLARGVAAQMNTPCRYDERMSLKEDYDYTAAVALPRSLTRASAYCAIAHRAAAAAPHWSASYVRTYWPVPPHCAHCAVIVRREIPRANRTLALHSLRKFTFLCKPCGAFSTRGGRPNRALTRTLPCGAVAAFMWRKVEIAALTQARHRRAL